MLGKLQCHQLLALLHCGCEASLDGITAQLLCSASTLMSWSSYCSLAVHCNCCCFSFCRCWTRTKHSLAHASADVQLVCQQQQQPELLSFEPSVSPARISSVHCLTVPFAARLVLSCLFVMFPSTATADDVCDSVSTTTTTAASRKRTCHRAQLPQPATQTTTTTHTGCLLSDTASALSLCVHHHQQSVGVTGTCSALLRIAILSALHR